MSHPVNTKAFQVAAVETKIFDPDRSGSLAKFIVDSVPRQLVHEKMVLLVTSKIVSLAERRLLKREQVASKIELVKKESDIYLGEIAMGVGLSIKEGLLIASAGIDESNSQHGDYILYPKNPWKSAGELWESLRSAWKLNDLAIILTDSRTEPLRHGVVGVGLSFWGFSPVEDLRESSDLFGRQFKMTTRNLADSLASAGVLAMGEGTQPLPLAVILGAELNFRSAAYSEKEVADLKSNWMIRYEDDLYFPLYEERLKKNQ